MSSASRKCTCPGCFRTHWLTCVTGCSTRPTSPDRPRPTAERVLTGPGRFAHAQGEHGDVVEQDTVTEVDQGPLQAGDDVGGAATAQASERIGEAVAKIAEVRAPRAGQPVSEKE